MGLVALDFVPGFTAEGTPYKRKNRWTGGDRVRWYNGLLRPIGGWRNLPTDSGGPVQIIPDPANQVSRSFLMWENNSGATQLVASHNGGLSAFSYATDSVHDITPVEFIPRPLVPGTNTGYGGGVYSADTYGTPRSAAPSGTRPVFSWVMRNFGENLLCSERISPSNLYEWDTNISNIATVVPNAPTGFSCMNVTQERIVMLGGAAGELRKIQWCDQEDYTQWAPAVDNQAGDFILPGIGHIQEIVSVQGGNLIVTENDAHFAKYVGPPYVYNFTEVGSNCGTIAGTAVVATKDFAVWVGRRSFYIFDGTVRELECPVIDDINRRVQPTTVRKATGFHNAAWSEIWWLFPGSGSSEPDSYVMWNYLNNHWVTGTLDRSVGGGPGVFGGPFMIGYDGVIYQHEVEGVIPGASASDVVALTAPLEVGTGDNMMLVDYLVPDFVRSGAVDVTFLCQDRPNTPEITVGPYRVDYSNINPAVSIASGSLSATSKNFLATRARGRQISIKITGASSLWELGNMRANIKKGGRR